MTDSTDPTDLPDAIAEARQALKRSKSVGGDSSLSDLALIRTRQERCLSSMLVGLLLGATFLIQGARSYSLFTVISVLFMWAMGLYSLFLFQKLERARRLFEEYAPQNLSDLAARAEMHEPQS